MKKKHSIIAAVIFIVGVVVFAIGFWSRVPAKPARASGGYTYYRAITVTSNPNIASGTLANFPMLVSSTASSWEPVSDGGHIQNLTTAPNGGQEPADLIFSTSPTCASPLNFETESYSSSTGALVDWVNVPTLATGTIIYACYGNSLVTTDQSNPSSTWNSNYAAVWHLSSASSTMDSTGNGFNLHPGLTTHAPTPTTTIIDGGSSFASTSDQYYYYASSSPWAQFPQISASIWFNSPNPCESGAAYSQNLLNNGQNAAGGFQFILRSNCSQGIALIANNTAFNSGFLPATSTWNYVVFTGNSTTVKMYVNGVLKGTTGAAWIATSSNTSYHTGIGDLINTANTGFNNPYAGLLDEARIASTTLSSQWILTEYNNQANPSTFYSLGDEVPASGYGYYRTITVTSTAGIASGTLTNFPMLVSSTFSSWEPTSDGGNIQNLCTAPNGAQEPCDLVFTTSTPSASGSSWNCGTPLNFETESYTSSTGALVDWVNVPTMSAGAVIYACYGNSSITTDQSQPSLTWNSNYAAVWHLMSQSGTSTPYLGDSTGDLNNGLPGTAAVTTTTCELPVGCANFKGSELINVGTSTSISLLTVPFTESAWVYTSSTTGGNDDILDEDQTTQEKIFRLNTGKVASYLGANEAAYSTTIATNSLHYVAISITGTASSAIATIYRDGIPQILNTSSSVGLNAQAVTIGNAFNGSNPFNGNIQEVRLSSVALSSQWIITEYNNQSNPSTFYSVGSETTPSGGGGSTGYTWTDAGGNGNWNTATNWSGGAVPGSTSTVIFSASSTANCALNAAVNVAGISIGSGYTGTITQNSGESITVGTSSWTQSGGIFTGSSASTTNDAITVNGAYSLAGGTFTSTAGSLTLAASSTMSGATFNNNSGTVIFAATTSTNPAVITGSATFYNLWLGNGGIYVNTSLTVATGTVLTSQNTLFFNTYTQNGSASVFVQLLGGGTIDAQGNVGAGEYMGYATSTVSFIVNGTGSQTLGETATCVAAGYTQPDCSTVFFPNLTITKTSGSVTLANYIDLAGNWTNTNATTINPGTSTVYFGSGDGEGNDNFYYLRMYQSWQSVAALATTTFAIAGSSTFYNLGIGNELGTNSITTIATGTVLTVQGYYSPITGGNYSQLLGGGQIDMQGDIQAGILQGYATSTVSMIVDGTGTQMLGTDDIACGSICDGLYLPNLTIAKPAGIAYLTSVGNPNAFVVQNTTTISSGEFSLSTSSNPISASFYGPLIVNSGAVLSDYPLAAASSTIQLGSSVTNNGLIFFDGSSLSCTVPLPNNVILQSTTTGQQVPWSGSGTFVMRYLNVEDQTSSVPITVLGGTNSGDNGSNWIFTTGPEPTLFQSASSSGVSGTKTLTVPFSYWPRPGDLILVAVSARNQSITTPTDTAGNVYTLVSSSTFGSDALSLYYAHNVSTTYGSFSVTANGTSSSTGDLLSLAAFEYDGMAPSSTYNNLYNANVDTSGSATTLNSNVVTGQSEGQLYFGLTSFVASTTATSGSGWTSEAGITNNNTTQALYTEQITTSTALTTSATWTSATSTSYAAAVAIFRSPSTNSYAATGTVDSATFDTGVASGTQLNSLIWQGSAPSTSGVGFQFAVSNSSNGPWNYVGPTGASSYFGYTLPGISTAPGTPINLGLTSGNYSLLNGYRYFRYRITLFSDPTYTYAPIVKQVIVNWSP